MKTFTNKLPALALLCLIQLPSVLHAQNQEQLKKAALTADSLFWRGYNTCDLQLQESLIADDIEFYHDKGGITLGKEAMVESIRKNLCGPDFRLHRVALNETVKTHLLKKADVLYGVLITGEHEFYLIPTGKAERLDGHASFSNLWLLKDGNWKLSRVFSYDHGPATYHSKKRQ